MSEFIPQLVSDEADITSVVERVTLVGNTGQTESPTINAPLEKKIPVTIITGYLGSGKSTLLEAIGRNSTKRLAIILNEFGDSSAIEKAVTIKDLDKAVQEWLDLGNGCLCCTVKDNGVMAIEQLIEKLGDRIDYILLETTGVADPAPIAQMFWLDDGLASRIYIDGVVTVVDAEHVLTCLDDVGGHWHRQHRHLKAVQTANVEPTEVEKEQLQLDEGITTAHLQIAMADTVLINKVDKFETDASHIETVRRRIHSINLTCPIHTTSFGDVPLSCILDLHAFESRLQQFTRELYQHSAYHDPRIATICLDFAFFTESDQFQKVEAFLQHVLWEQEFKDLGMEVHRIKGLLCQSGTPPIVKVVQGVRETYEIIDDAQLVEGVECNKLVFIGKGLQETTLQRQLDSFLR